jgi:hypothetical protein
MTTTLDEVWALFKEVAEAQRETERKFQETEHRFQETDHRFQETDRRFQESVAENERVLKQLSKQIGDLGGAWGQFVENMVAPACETLFLNRGIPVHQVSQRVKKRQNGDTLEIDILVLNQDHVLAVEVKSRLSVADVQNLIADLQRFRQFFPEYAQKQLYGAIAGMSIDEGADRHAYRQGLFVLAQSGETVTILNSDSFQPKAW